MANGARDGGGTARKILSRLKPAASKVTSQQPGAVTMKWETILALGFALGWSAARFSEGQTDMAVRALIGGLIFTALVWQFSKRSTR